MKDESRFNILPKHYWHDAHKSIVKRFVKPMKPFLKRKISLNKTRAAWRLKGWLRVGIGDRRTGIERQRVRRLSVKRAAAGGGIMI
jgi:hypothetical protein